jgi:undecaprenyl-diphosphatase
MNIINAIFIFGAKYLFILSIIIAGWYFFKQSRSTKREMIIFGLIVVIVAGVIAFIAGHLYYDPRPFIVDHFTPLIPHADDNGFPSDHTLLVGAIASIIFVYSRKISLYLWIIAIAVGISRVYVGVHHITDILGSIIITIFATYLVHIFWRKYRK